MTVSQTTQFLPTLRPDAPNRKAGGPSTGARSFAQISIYALSILLAALLCYKGYTLRQWAYVWSGENNLRFKDDLTAAWRRGTAVRQEAQKLVPQNQVNPKHIPFTTLYQAYLGRYESEMRQHPDGAYLLDYPPARLLVMSVWVWRMNERGLPQPFRDADAYKLADPLPWVNLGFEVAGMIAMYMLVRLVLNRQQTSHAELIALIPPLLFWLDPAVITNAHVWPQWDTWIIPFYLFAAYFGFKRRWLLTGICLGLGAMFKGQLLLTMVIFILWPLFQFRIRGMIEVIIGTLLAAMLYVLPWMLDSLDGRAFFIFVMLLTTYALIWWIRRGWRILFLSAMTGISLLCAGYFFHGSWAWFQVGFEYGTVRHYSMTMGPVLNLPAILASHYRWRVDDPVTFNLSFLHITTLPLRTLLISVYFIGLILCAIGLARHDARKDSRALLALATPWILMFTLLAQMHDRYLLWAAALTSMAAAVALGPALLHVLITLLACLPMWSNMITYNNLQRVHPDAWNFFSRTAPDAGWLTILACLMMVYWAVTPGRRKPLAEIGIRGGSR